MKSIRSEGMKIIDTMFYYYNRESGYKRHESMCMIANDFNVSTPSVSNWINRKTKMSEDVAIMVLNRWHKIKDVYKNAYNQSEMFEKPVKIRSSEARSRAMKIIVFLTGCLKDDYNSEQDINGYIADLFGLCDKTIYHWNRKTRTPSVATAKNIIRQWENIKHEYKKDSNPKKEIETTETKEPDTKRKVIHDFVSYIFNNTDELDIYDENIIRACFLKLNNLE